MEEEYLSPIQKAEKEASDKWRQIRAKLLEHYAQKTKIDKAYSAHVLTLFEILEILKKTPNDWAGLIKEVFHTSSTDMALAAMGLPYHQPRVVGLRGQKEQQSKLATERSEKLAKFGAVIEKLRKKRGGDKNLIRQKFAKELGINESGLGGYLASMYPSTQSLEEAIGIYDRDHGQKPLGERRAEEMAQKREKDMHRITLALKKFHADRVATGGRADYVLSKRNAEKALGLKDDKELEQLLSRTFGSGFQKVLENIELPYRRERRF